MMLVEECKIALEDPVDKFIPEWKNSGVYVSGVYPTFQTKPPTKPMQVIDLLRHTSGLTYGFQNRTNVDAALRAAGLEGSASGMPLEEFIKKLGEVPLEFSPGEAWNYSLATDVLGYIVQVVSKMPFEKFLKERLIDPLGMVDTDFHVPADKADRFVACYGKGPDGKCVLIDDPTKSKYLAPPSFVSGGGGLVSTAQDYLRFCTMMLNGGKLDGKRYLSRKTVALMTTNHLPGGGDLTHMSRSMFSEATNAGIGFGLGFAVNMDPAKAMISSSKGEYYWGWVVCFIGRAGARFRVISSDLFPPKQRSRVHRLLGRSYRRNRRYFHDSADAFECVPDSQRASHACLLCFGRLERQV